MKMSSSWMFQRFDKRKKLLHNLASVLMRKLLQPGSKAVPNQRSETSSARDEAVKQGDLHDAKRWFRIAGSLQRTTKRKSSRQAGGEAAKKYRIRSTEHRSTRSLKIKQPISVGT